MINRLIGIIYILLNKGTVTASELAERFEVSVRTVYRDVEQLSMAGIPVYARKGKNGGISLTENFVLNKMVISEEEQKSILSALASLRETGALREEETLRRLGDFFQAEVPDWVAIDFSDWGGRQKDTFGLLRKAILEKYLLEFDYYGQYGDMSHRTVEPVQLVYKEYAWYLRAFCRKRQAMRFFKVLRMKRVEMLEKHFEGNPEKYMEYEKRNAETNGDSQERKKKIETFEIVFQVKKSEAYRVYDKFEEDEITILPNGDFQISINYPVDDWTYGLILSFGPSAKVISPEAAKVEMRKRLGEMQKNYL